MLLAPATPDDIRLAEVTDTGHPRVRRALRYRDDVRVYANADGLVLIGRGLAGRQECAVEVPELYRNAGAGRRLAAAARSLVPPGTHVWAQVTPGNAASLRAFLAAGFRPIGSEALLVREPSGDRS
jgi:RimJ/RimL family protein N-acetyltransferase